MSPAVEQPISPRVIGAFYEANVDKRLLPVLRLEEFRREVWQEGQREQFVKFRFFCLFVFFRPRIFFPSVFFVRPRIWDFTFPVASY